MAGKFSGFLSKKYSGGSPGTNSSQKVRIPWLFNFIISISEINIIPISITISIPISIIISIPISITISEIYISFIIAWMVEALMSLPSLVVGNWNVIFCILLPERILFGHIKYKICSVSRSLLLWLNATGDASIPICPCWSQTKVKLCHKLNFLNWFDYFVKVASSLGIWGGSSFVQWIFHLPHPRSHIWWKWSRWKSN